MERILFLHRPLSRSAAQHVHPVKPPQSRHYQCRECRGGGLSLIAGAMEKPRGIVYSRQRARRALAAAEPRWRIARSTPPAGRSATCTTRAGGSVRAAAVANDRGRVTGPSILLRAPQPACYAIYEWQIANTHQEIELSNCKTMLNVCYASGAWITVRGRERPSSNRRREAKR